MGSPNGLERYLIPTPIPDPIMISDARAGNSHWIFGGMSYLSSKLPPKIRTAPPKIIAKKNFLGIILKSKLPNCKYIAKAAKKAKKGPREGAFFIYQLRPHGI